MANEFVLKSVDVLWDGWLNGFKTLQQVQEEVEKKTLETLAAQQQLLEKTNETYVTLEEQAKKFSDEWQLSLKSNVAKLPNQSQLQTWLESVQELTEKTQSFVWKPNHILFDLTSNAQSQWEEAVKTAFSQQQEKRKEAIVKIEEIAQQLKENHKQLVGATK